jgi:DNA-directed RNA polymerase subunit L
VKLEQQADADRRNPQHALLAAIEDVRERLEELERHVRAASPRDSTTGARR